MLQNREKNPQDVALQKVFGRYIKSARERQGLYQRQMADLVGVSQQYYSKIENGVRNVDFAVAIRICKVLRLDISDFIKSYIQ